MVNGHPLTSKGLLLINTLSVGLDMAFKHLHLHLCSVLFCSTDKKLLLHYTPFGSSYPLGAALAGSTGLALEARVLRKAVEQQFQVPGSDRSTSVCPVRPEFLNSLQK